MYPDYLAFFSAEIVKHGVGGALERYVFSPEANGNGSLMLARFVGGLLHPIIQAGVRIHVYVHTAPSLINIYFSLASSSDWVSWSLKVCLQYHPELTTPE